MNIETELRLLLEPILEWAASIDRRTLEWSLLGVLAAIFLRRPIARWILSLNIKMLRSMSLNPPDSVRVQLETALRIIIVCAAALLAFHAVNLPALIDDILQKLTFTVIVISLFAAWYNLAATFISVINPKQLDGTMKEMDWAVSVTHFVIILLGIAALLELWSVDVTAALTGVGVFGAGLAIAAQDMLRNLFAGMSNVSEKRFVTGDWIHVDGVAEGRVNHIDLRSTTIIGFDRVPRYVPNADLANATVENLSRRDHRWIKWMVPIVLSATNEQLEEICARVRKHLKTSGDFVIRDDMLCLVQVEGLSPSAVEVKIYAFTVVNDYARYLKVCERLTACIRRTVDQVGTSLAYPTHSLIIQKSTGDTVDQ